MSRHGEASMNLFQQNQPVVGARVRRVGVGVVLAPLLWRLRHFRGRDESATCRVERKIRPGFRLFSFALFTLDQDSGFRIAESGTNKAKESILLCC